MSASLPGLTGFGVFLVSELCSVLELVPGGSSDCFGK